MFETLLVIGILSVIARAYYKELDHASKSKCDFRNDGHLHLIQPDE